MHVVDRDEHWLVARSDFEDLSEFLEQPEPLISGTFEGSNLISVDDRWLSARERREQRREWSHGRDLIGTARGDDHLPTPRARMSLADDPRLADAGLAIEQQQTTAAAVECVEHVVHRRHLGFASSEGRNRVHHPPPEKEPRITICGAPSAVNEPNLPR
jgi:hypothetical protein